MFLLHLGAPLLCFITFSFKYLLYELKNFSTLIFFLSCGFACLQLNVFWLMSLAYEVGDEGTCNSNFGILKLNFLLGITISIL